MQFFRGVPIQSGFSPTAETSARPAETVAWRRGTRIRKVAELTPRILHVTAELWPYAWSGGLGHAVADLADQQAQNGRDVTVVTPLYAAARSAAGQVWPACEPFRVHYAGADVLIQCVESQRRRNGPRVIFVDHPAAFDRAGLYGENGSDYADNASRFALLSLAAIEFARRMNGGRQLVVHSHDWHAALAPVYMRAVRSWDADLARVASVASVHNAGYQGLFSRETLGAIGLPDSLWSFDAMEWHGNLSFLKGALKFADIVTTVSETHADEIRSEVGGFGLHDAFRSLGDRLVGIRNGIDQRRWDPATDREIPARFHVADLRGKARCKADLQLAGRLPRAEVPLFAMSARMVRQKGVDLVLGSRAVRESKAQFVFLGQGEPGYEAALGTLAQELPGRVAARTSFCDRFEHQLLAGADYLLMPSLYEPCGLTQMRAQRYGTLPVARRVGGLAETVEDGATGFLFDDFSVEGLDGAVERAIVAFRNPGEHAERMVRAMGRDFSWQRPLAQYDEVYRRAMAAR